MEGRILQGKKKAWKPKQTIFLMKQVPAVWPHVSLFILLLRGRKGKELQAYSCLSGLCLHLSFAPCICDCLHWEISLEPADPDPVTVRQWHLKRQARFAAGAFFAFGPVASGPRETETGLYDRGQLWLVSPSSSIPVTLRCFSWEWILCARWSSD